MDVNGCFTMETMVPIPRQNCAWDDDRIEQYSMGALRESELAEFEEHLLVCEVCQERLANVDAFRSGMRRAGLRLRRQSSLWQHSTPLFRRLFPVLACAAAVLLLALAGLRWLRPSAPAPLFAVTLEAMRGSEPGAQAPAGRPLSFRADLSGLPVPGPYRLELVDSEGRSRWTGPDAGVTLPPLKAGSYFMRVYSSGGQLLREYGLNVR